MPLGILIPADSDQPARTVQLNGLDDYIDAVGGYIEAIDLHKPEMELIVAEEGKLERKPLNRRATIILMYHNRDYLFSDWVAGDALLVGPGDIDGNWTDAPPKVIDMMFSEHTFVLFIPINEQGTKLLVMANVEFTDWESAYQGALQKIDELDIPLSIAMQ